MINYLTLVISISRALGGGVYSLSPGTLKGEWNMCTI